MSWSIKTENGGPVLTADTNCGYALTQVNNSLDAPSGSQYSITLDLVSGYWQVILDADVQEKPVFSTHTSLWK